MNWNRVRAQPAARSQISSSGNLEDARPECRVLVLVAPRRAQMPLEQRGQLGRHPCRHVHAVRDRADRPVGRVDARATAARTCRASRCRAAGSRR